MSNNYDLNKGFCVSVNRINKAKKIVTILKEELNSDLKDCIVLDIGTGSGDIANHIARIAKHVVSIDISDNRSEKGLYDFFIGNENLPFKDSSFDIIISNHVIEHVTNNKQHLKEIHRVLKQDGLVYLATPNRLWPWEVHYNLPLLHYLPKKMFINLLKQLNIYHEDLSLLFWNQLKQLVNDPYTLTIYSDRIISQPDKYYINTNNLILKVLKLLPLKFYTFITFINPTFIVTLRKKIHPN